MTGCSQHNMDGMDCSNKVQDTSQAVKFFDDELSFTVGPMDVKNVVDGKEKNITIVDVRAEADYAKDHIPGAINIPCDKHNYFKGSETEFSGLRKDGFNYVYCYEMLCNLSQEAAKKFASLGYPVKEVKGGFKAWQKKHSKKHHHGKKKHKAGKKHHAKHAKKHLEEKVEEKKEAK